MDTDHFIVRRHQVVERMEARRARELTSYPFKVGGAFGVSFPGWVRVGLSLLPRGGVATALMGTVVPMIASFWMEKKSSFVSRLLSSLTRS